MSRIGYTKVAIPEGVEVKAEKDRVVVSGPKGSSEQPIDPEVNVKVEDEGFVQVDRNSEKSEVKAKHGMTRSLIQNMVIGVSEGFKIQQELNGVGYRATVQGQRLNLVLGLSHQISFEVPEEVKVSAETPKRANPIITLESHDKQLVGQVAAKIRSFRPPEPYKGKGIRYMNEEIRRKAGKAAGKA